MQACTFNKHFEKYGEITNSVIMKDRYTGQTRGFGFVTYADPSVIENVIKGAHVINGKHIEIKRTIPKGSGQSKDFKTKKIFVGGLQSIVTENEFKDFFSKHGKVEEHHIIRDHETNCSRGFGFIIFESKEVVDEILSEGNMIDMADTQVEIKKVKPMKASKPPHGCAFGNNSRVHSFSNGFGGFGSPYGSYDSGFGAAPYRAAGGLGSRLGRNDGYPACRSCKGGF